MDCSWELGKRAYPIGHADCDSTKLPRHHCGIGGLLKRRSHYKPSAMEVQNYRNLPLSIFHWARPITSIAEADWFGWYEHVDWYSMIFPTRQGNHKRMRSLGRRDLKDTQGYESGYLDQACAPLNMPREAKEVGESL